MRLIFLFELFHALLFCWQTGQCHLNIGAGLFHAMQIGTLLMVRNVQTLFHREAVGGVVRFLVDIGSAQTQNFINNTALAWIDLNEISAKKCAIKEMANKIIGI